MFLVNHIETKFSLQMIDSMLLYLSIYLRRLEHIMKSSWPFEQANLLLKKASEKKCVIFETGFGPSGNPTIGTFAEVVRTNMVRNAFEELTEGKISTRLIAFSDDYDGFRKVPENLPDTMKIDLGKPLTSVSDPYGEFPSFAHRNNQALRDFLDDMEIGYEFMSATECYKSGRFNDILAKIAQNYEKVRGIMLPTLGVERRATYSPFMPISPYGQVLQTGVKEVDPVRNTILFDDENGEEHEISIFNGNVKSQWKIAWAERFAALGVDYEMHGKDLSESAVLSKKICKAIGYSIPHTFQYELFLDDQGHKISKSLGNGFSTEEWLQYSSRSALAFYMYQNPTQAKILSSNVVPRMTDDYLKSLNTYRGLSEEARLDSPIWHVHEGYPPEFSSDVSYGLLVNLAEVSGATDPETLLNYLRQYKDVNEQDMGIISELISGVIQFVQAKPKKVKRAPTELEANAFKDLAIRLSVMEDGLNSEDYQYEVYEIGKKYGFDPLRNWFKAIYEVMFGDDQGPRFGSFIAAYGRERSIAMIKDAANRE